MSSNTVWKFTVGVTDETVLAAPRGATVLHASAPVDGEVTLWMLVDAESPVVPHRLTIAGTGHPLPGNATPDSHVATVVTPSRFVWHLFDLREAQ